MSTVDLQAVLCLRSFDEFADHLRYALQGFAWPAVQSIASPPAVKGAEKPSPVPDLLNVIELAPSYCTDLRSVTLRFGALASLHWGGRPDGQSFSLSIGFPPTNSPFRDPVDGVRALTHVARRLLERGVAMQAAVERYGEGACVPLVPLAKTKRSLVLTTDDEVAAEYDRPDDFWSAGWHIETFGGQKLLTRCQDVIARADVLAEIQDHQWQMARAAKPKRTKYGTPEIAPEEREIYEEGEPRLQPVGRHRTTGVVEYSCVLEEGDHLRGFEIFYLRSLVKNKRMQDGTPLTSVRVVFLEPWMAESEKRPLLDNGVDVYYEDVNTGEIVQVTE